jgi:hypothetical protein
MCRDKGSPIAGIAIDGIITRTHMSALCPIRSIAPMLSADTPVPSTRFATCAGIFAADLLQMQQTQIDDLDL